MILNAVHVADPDDDDKCKSCEKIEKSFSL